MSTESAPTADDRPVVDGTQKTSEQLRAELDRLLEEQAAEDRAAEERAAQERAARERAAERDGASGPAGGSGETVAELAARAGLVKGGSDTAAGSSPPPAEVAEPDPTPRVGAGKDEAVARMQQQVDRARVAVPEKAAAVRHTVQDKASAARDTVREKPQLLAALVGLLVLVAIARRLLTRR